MMFALSFAHQHRYIVQMFSNELAARRVSTRTDLTDWEIRTAREGER